MDTLIRFTTMSGVAALAMLLLCPPARASYVQVNLASDIQGLAANTDANLKNPWGMSFSATSPFWVSNQITGNATLYNGAGAPQALIVNTGPTPTGQVFSNLPSAYNGDTFIFDTLTGKIVGWRNALGTVAETLFTSPGAVYTGLAIGTGSTPDLYAANNAGGIDVYNNSGLTTVPGGFLDPNLPAGFSPYNIQNISGLLYVTYASPSGGGVVDVFDLNGNLIQRVAANGPTGVLQSPWGVAVAPAGFGQFGGDLLIGNEDDGKINAFNPTTGVFLGTLTDLSGNPIINDGLWAISFRASGSGFNPNALFINAGINNQQDGLFAEILAVPEPGTMALLIAGLGGMALLARKRIRVRTQSM